MALAVERIQMAPHLMKYIFWWSSVLFDGLQKVGEWGYPLGMYQILMQGKPSDVCACSHCTFWQIPCGEGSVHVQQHSNLRIAAAEGCLLAGEWYICR